MKIVELFSRLAYGELSNLSINKGGGKLDEAKHPQIVQYANDGLLRLFSRFILKEKEVIIEQTEHVINYHLRREFAVSSNSSAVRHRYILDDDRAPFVEDVIKILEVYDEDGCQYVLNDKDNTKSLFTPRPNTLQIPAPVNEAKVSILYQARHRLLDDRPEHILNQEIEIPFFFENALQNYIAYKVYSDMNGQENIIKGDRNLAAYEAICLDAEARDLVNQTFQTSHQKLEQRGFV